MSSNRPVVVFVHGGYQTPATYQKFFNALIAEGFEVYAPLLPTSADPSKCTPASDIATVRSQVAYLVEAGKRVMLMMHSYGDTVGTTAIHDLAIAQRRASGLPGGVTHLLYMCAFILPENTTMSDFLKDAKFEAEGILDISADGTSFPVDLKDFLFNKAADEDARTYQKTLVRAPLALMAEPKMEYTAWKDVPATYIFMTEDHALPLLFQKMMTDMVKSKGVTLQEETLSGGHSPHITKTQEVLKIVKRLLEA